MISLNGHQYVVKFFKQPPSHLRKSNFFSFKLVMHDLENQPIAVENAQFVDFIDTTEVGIYNIKKCLCVRTRACVYVYVYASMHKCTCIRVLHACVYRYVYVRICVHDVLHPVQEINLSKLNRNYAHNIHMDRPNKPHNVYLTIHSPIVSSAITLKPFLSSKKFVIKLPACLHHNFEDWWLRKLKFMHVFLPCIIIVRYLCTSFRRTRHTAMD